MSFKGNDTKMRIAVAMAILRHKPGGLTGEAYTRQLAEGFQRGQLQWQQRCREAESEILHLRQQLVIQKNQQQTSDSQFNFDSVTSGSQPLFFTPPPSGSNDNTVTMPHPTPPLSGSNDNTVNEPQPTPSSQEPSLSSSATAAAKSLNRHTEFLHHLIQLKRSSLALSLGSADKFSSDVLKDSLIHSLHLLSRQLGKGEYNWNVQKHCLKCVLTLIQGVNDDLRMQLLERMSDLTSCLISKILDGRDFRSEANSNIVDLLSEMGSSPHTQPLVVRHLCESIYTFSQHLRLVARGETALDTFKFNNMYYIFSACQHALITSVVSQMDSSVRELVTQRLEDSLLHLTESFPLFAHAIWKLLRSL